MSKDPAFLFYPNDYLGGTMGMTHEMKGAYVDLLIFQFNNGHFDEAQAKQVLSICFTRVWDVLKSKFKNEGENGEFYYNERLRIEVEKRKAFTESRKINALQRGKHKKAYAQHMGNENENRNGNKKRSKKEKEKTVFILPEDINKETWQAFEEMRKKKKAPLTDRARELICIELDKIYKEHGHDKNAVLLKSVKSSWTDVYPLKDQPQYTSGNPADEYARQLGEKYGKGKSSPLA